MINRRLRSVGYVMAGSILLVILIRFGIGLAPFIFSDGKNCADPRGARHRGLYTAGSTFCRQSGGKATLSTCGPDGRWTHKPVERCF